MKDIIRRKILFIGMMGIILGGFICFPVNAYAGNGFQVNGTKLQDGNGNEFIMRGVNYPHAWYKTDYQTAIPAIADKGFNSVRIVLSDGGQWTKTSREEVEALINICKQEKLIAILEVHDATGSDDAASLNRAVSYWSDMQKLLNDNKDYVILNIANEWYGTWDDGSSWKNGYISAIKTLRNAGIKNTLMVDCAGWGQYPKVIFDHGKAVLEADSNKNTMFSVHMYEYAGGNAAMVKENIDNVLNQNLCLTIGEFGPKHTDGDVDEDTIMSYCQQKGAGWLAWSWYGNNYDLDYLDLVYGMDGSKLTDFGERVINGSNGTKETSKLCTIFDGPIPDDDEEKTNLFFGSAYADNWGQAVSVKTAKNGGSCNMPSMDSKGYIYVEYSGAYNEIELILQSWSGGSDWCRISPSEDGKTDNGTYYVKYNYQDIVNAYGTNLDTTDVVHIGARSNGITVYSVDFWSSKGGSGGDDEDRKVNLFYGNSYSDNWGQAVSLDAAKNGGQYDLSSMKSGGYIYVEYTGAYNGVELILQSRSGGSDWCRISPSEDGNTNNGTYFTKYYYQDIVNAYGSDFGTVDVIHIGAMSDRITVKSVDAWAY